MIVVAGRPAPKSATVKGITADQKRRVAVSEAVLLNRILSGVRDENVVSVDRHTKRTV